MKHPELPEHPPIRMIEISDPSRSIFEGVGIVVLILCIFIGLYLLSR